MFPRVPTWNSDKSFQVMTRLGAAQGRFDRSAAQHSTNENGVKLGLSAESGPWFNLQVRSSSLFARLVKKARKCDGANWHCGKPPVRSLRSGGQLGAGCRPLTNYNSRITALYMYSNSFHRSWSDCWSFPFFRSLASTPLFADLPRSTSPAEDDLVSLSQRLGPTRTFSPPTDLRLWFQAVSSHVCPRQLKFYT